MRLPFFFRKGRKDVMMSVYYARRNGAFYPTRRKAFKKARWQKSYAREVKRVKMLFIKRAFGI